MFPNLFAFSMLIAVTVLASFLLGFGVASAMAEYRQRQAKRDTAAAAFGQREKARFVAEAALAKTGDPRDYMRANEAFKRDPDAAFSDALRGQPHDINHSAYDAAIGEALEVAASTATEYRDTGAAVSGFMAQPIA